MDGGITGEGLFLRPLLRRVVVMTRVCGWLSLLLVLAACTAPQPIPAPPEPLPPNPKFVPVAARVSLLLGEAERALAADRLLSPASNNAYDRYRTVLLLMPGNMQARSGLQQIVIRYLQLGRQALARNKLSLAQSYARRALQVNGKNPLLAEFEQSLQQARQLAEVSSGGAEYDLDVQALGAHHESVRKVLKEVVGRVRHSHESLLIVARTDTEGRWLYQQMRSVAGDYRIRGDIRLGQSPKIVLLPPIE